MSRSNPIIAAVKKILDDADAARRSAKLSPFTASERALAMSYFCEGVRWQQRAAAAAKKLRQKGAAPNSENSRLAPVTLQGDRRHDRKGKRSPASLRRV